MSEWRVCSTEQSERVELAFVSLMVQTLSEPQLVLLRAAVVVERGEGAFSRGKQTTRPWSRMDKGKRLRGLQPVRANGKVPGAPRSIT